MKPHLGLRIRGQRSSNFEIRLGQNGMLSTRPVIVGDPIDDGMPSTGNLGSCETTSVRQAASICFAICS